MLLPRFVVVTALMVAMGAGATLVCAQTPSTGSGQAYPNKVIRIFTAGVGGGSDFIARLIAQGISGPLGQQVIVENRSGVVPGETVAQAAADGHTIILAAGTLWIGPLLRKTTFDPIRDFAPVSLTTRAPNVVVVHPSLPVKTIKELIALAKSKPGALNYSTGASGASSHLAAELFKSMANVNMVRIPYKNGATENADLLSGQVQLTFGAAGAVGPFIKQGRLRGLAVSSSEPSSLFPGLPSITASGVPGYESETNYGFLVPARTPEAVIRRLNQETVRFLQIADTKEKFIGSSLEAVGSPAEVFAAVIKSEMTRMGKLIKDAGIRDD